jgi:hypothetical protein
MIEGESCVKYDTNWCHYIQLIYFLINYCWFDVSVSVLYEYYVDYELDLNILTLKSKTCARK